MSRGYLIKNYYSNTDGKSINLSGHDVITLTLDKHYDDLIEHFNFYNYGQTGRINHYMNKDVMLKLASKHGLNVAKTWHVSVGDVPEDIEFPIMTKALNSLGKEWKDIVFICKNIEQLLDAYSHIESDTVLLQRYIDKVDEVSFQGISCDRGKQVQVLTTMRQQYNIHDKYSPLWIVSNNRNKRKKFNNIEEDIKFS